MQPNAPSRLFQTLVAIGAVFLASFGGALPVHGLAAALPPHPTPAPLRRPVDIPTNQILIRYKSSSPARLRPGAPDVMQRLGRTAGATFQYGRHLFGAVHVLRLPARLPLAQVQAIVARLKASPDVQDAVPDRRAFALTYPAAPARGVPARPALLTPDDTNLSDQWNLNGTWGIDAPAAWDYTTGSSSIVVADLDSGITPHSEFSGRIVPGYDFISDPNLANDSDPSPVANPNRDSDPSDPGDWVTSDDSAGITYGGFFTGCPIQDSRWHGTLTAGLIGATGNNGQGIAGLNWGSKILPVRVLGKCGGNFSDIIDGMRWAAGLHVDGVPDNANPARVINVSLGVVGACDSVYQDPIDEIVNVQHAVVVVAAGDSALNVSNAMPADCNGVITVAATNNNSDLSYYSNYGALVKLSAPGGEQWLYNDPTGVFSTSDTGTQGPVADGYVFQQGSSLAAPQVSGVAALLLSLKPSLTPAQVLQILQDTAKPFPGGATCTTSNCGAGLLDAGAAMAALADPGVATFTATTPFAGLNIPITAFTATDVVPLTGYMITESFSAPSAGAGGWSGTPPTTFSVVGEGAHTLYPWVKDLAGQVSPLFGSPAGVVVDTTAPAVTGFGAAALSGSLAVPLTTFTASDGNGVAGYMVTETSTPPDAGASGWSGSAPGSYTVAGDGAYTLYPWAKDGAGNVSALFGTPAGVVVDTTAPAVNSFTATSPSTGLAIPITAFTAADTNGVSAYKITESSAVPAAGASGWSASAPGTYTVGGDGLYTLYPWAKDAAGNVSAVFASPASVLVDTTVPTVSSSVPADANPTALASVHFTVTFSEAVTGVDAADFSLNSAGVASPAITGVTGSGASYSVTVDTGSGNGSIRLDVLDDHSIHDLAGNQLGGPYSGVQSYTVNKPITQTFTSAAPQDGWVLESGENTNLGGTLNAGAATFQLGDDAANRQYRAILSFNTAALPDDAQVQSALLKIKQSGAPSGSNPFNALGSLWADIRMGSFGGPGLALTDFGAPASAKKVGAFGKVPVSGWYTDTLTALGLGKVNLAGLTQFRLYFAKDDNNNHRADFMKFISGNGAAAGRPVLVITYTLP